ncbi:MAG: Maf family protein [Candidatus Levyibacteriota bacterium]
MKKIILASASPRREELLKNIGLKFSVEPSNLDENMTLNLKPAKLAEFLSFQKAKTVAKKYKNSIIIAADTIVVIGNDILGKAHTDKEAKQMLNKLNGKSHLVITGFTIIDSNTNKKVTKSEKTKVFFKKLNAHEIDNYIATGEPVKKGGAGSYCIQGFASMFIKKIKGDYFNVVGLPIYSLMESLKKFGIKVL